MFNVELIRSPKSVVIKISFWLSISLFMIESQSLKVRHKFTESTEYSLREAGSSCRAVLREKKKENHPQPSFQESLDINHCIESYWKFKDFLTSTCIFLSWLLLEVAKRSIDILEIRSAT